ncbi:hypothetical protein [Acinetobacter baumannii]|uniref:hypothetical protein n=1 Tax=Acinetobacter baumannii TaxID=470 RepID=UPI001FD69668|nr:hypothetical protein [Acinetobacter baumannii]
MDDRNLELEAWLIETAGEEMMANHLGSNWNKFNEEFGFYPNMAMTVADLVWQHQQAKVEELQTLYTQQGINMLKMQKRVDAVTHLIRGLRAEFDLWMDVECPQVERQIELLEQALKGEGQ